MNGNLYEDDLMNALMPIILKGKHMSDNLDRLEEFDEDLKQLFKSITSRSTVHASVMIYRMKAYVESLETIDRIEPLPNKYKEMAKNINELIHCFEVMLDATSGE